MRIALLTLEALANARAVRRFVAADPGRIAMIGLSDPFRAEKGGALGQTWTRLKGSGPRLLPYLFLNFSLPRLVGALPGRDGGAPEATPLRRLAERHGITAETVPDVNAEAFRRRIAASGADVIVTFHFDQILTAETIAAAPLGGLNVHPSLLPDHRGPVPTIHALLDDPVRLGVSIHRLVPKIDAGGLVAQAGLADEPALTSLGAAARLHEAAIPLLDRALADLAAGRLAETALPLLPYRGFPTRADLARLAGKGRRPAGWSDLRAALATPISA